MLIFYFRVIWVVKEAGTYTEHCHINLASWGSVQTRLLYLNKPYLGTWRRKVLYQTINEVSLSIITQQVCCALLQKEHLTTCPHPEPRNHGFHNKSYIEEPNTNEPGPQHDYTHDQAYIKPYFYTGGDLKRTSITPPQPLTNGGPPWSVAVSGTNLPSPATPPYITELLHAQNRYHQPSAPGENYERQELNRMSVSSDLKGMNGADDHIRAPHIQRTDSVRPYQPPIKNRPAPVIPFPRVDLHCSAVRTNEEYLEPR